MVTRTRGRHTRVAGVRSKTTTYAAEVSDRSLSRRVCYTLATSAIGLSSALGGPLGGLQRPV